jgi:hypothetical protein
LRNDDVRLAAEQVWQNYDGAEYLAANPVFINNFQDMCRSAMGQEGNFHANQSPFSQRPSEQTLTTNTNDLFFNLPVELKVQIVQHLTSKDLAALRLSSRAFTHLPGTVWNSLLRREMPFIYEAWSDHAAPYHWSCLDARALHDDMRDIYTYVQERHYKARELGDMTDQVLLSRWHELNPLLPPRELSKLKLDACTPSRSKAVALPILRMPLDGTNWYQLYRGIVVNWKNLKGLRNRERIWHDMLHIVHNIKAGRQAVPDAKSDFFTMEGVEWVRPLTETIGLDDEEMDRLYSALA